MAETPTTASVTIFPTTNDVVGGDVVAGLSAAGSGKTIGELAWRYLRANPYMGHNYVRQSTYALVSGRTFRQNSTIAQIAGYLVLCDATAETLTTEASTTCYTWLQLVRNASAQVTGARWVVTNSTALPALPTNGITGDQVMIGYQTANASAITAQGNTYRGIIHSGKELYSFAPSAVASPGDAGNVSIVQDGVTTLEVGGTVVLTDSTGAQNVLGFQIRDAAGGGGTQVASGQGNNNSGMAAFDVSVPIAPERLAITPAAKTYYGRVSCTGAGQSYARGRISFRVV